MEIWRARNCLHELRILTLEKENTLMELEKARPSRETIGERSRTHGMVGTKFYTKYFSIVQRCNDPKSTSYPRYGGKGVKNLWGSFEEFKTDMFSSYLAHVAEHGERQTTIDRLDNNGHYCKENCRWATMKEQANNKRDNRPITFSGKTLSVADWARETGINVGTILSRYYRGWTPERIFTKRRMHKNGELLYVEYRNENKTLKQWAKEVGIKYPTLYYRIVLNGWPVERAFTTKVK